ncbi:S41 family peptidase [Flavobacteriales bacterium]|nr:S41 family peptidase [Flavobacteriales bacterium]MDC1063761.1 S41 family peptidase [Flavobacteriales bacterium]
MQNKYNPIIFACLIAVGIFIGQKISNKDQVRINDKINSIIQLINSHYVDTLNNNFEEEIINSIIKDLDPHTSYISKKSYKSVEESMQGGFSGIGIEFNIINDTIVVVSPINGGPSQKLGVQSGDRIVMVDSTNVSSIGIENNGVIKKLRGKKGTTVSVLIKRRGLSELIKFNITRNTIPLNSVDVAMMLNSDVGLIKINRFSAKTTNEFNKAAYKLLESGMKKLIIDLRDNPGGYLSAAVNICDNILQEGELIVFTKGRMREKSEIFSNSTTELEKTEIIILINEGSASASEIIAGAIQDNDRGLIIGRRSFGKGLVQEEIKLNDGSAIRLTTQRYYTPSGRSIQKEYGNSNEEYFLEQYIREDTLYLDSVKYQTKKGRLVYGGGGITPDIRIERDTNLNFLLINQLIIKGWIRDFSMQYSDKNRNNLFKTEDSEEYLIRMEEIIYNRFTNFVNKKDKDLLKDAEVNEEDYIKRLIISNIARNIWGNEDYYKIKIKDDQFITKALSNLN